MSYNDFKSIEEIIKKFSVEVDEVENRYTDIQPLKISNEFIKKITIASALAEGINTEQAKMALIVSNLLFELKLQNAEISFFLGRDFTVDKKLGLTGRPDGLITKSKNQYFIEQPVVCLVEAKNDNINQAIPQCMAEMIAAQIYNHNDTNIYGTVTNGDTWMFLCLANKKFTLNTVRYYLIHDLEKIMSILLSFTH